MRTTRMKTAVVAVATAGLLALGSMAYADDNEVNMGGTGGAGGTATSGSGATNTGNTAGDGTSTNGDAGDATVTQSPSCGGATTPNQGGAGTGGLINVAVPVSVGPICPTVNAPILSEQNGGDANGGTATGGNSNSSAQSSSNASANGGNGGSAGVKDTDGKSKKHCSNDGIPNNCKKHKKKSKKNKRR
jgi:hypothetical protein